LYRVITRGNPVMGLKDCPQQPDSFAATKKPAEESAGFGLSCLNG